MRTATGPTSTASPACRRTCTSGRSARRTVWHQACDSAHVSGPSERMPTGAEEFLKQLAWREFAAQLLSHFPRTASQPLREEFQRFPWRTDAAALRAWQRGRTGYPLVDAGMRQLWAIGWMHNRVRLVAASFLVKHLLLAVAGGGTLVLGYPRRCRPRGQHPQLAVDGGLRRGRRSVFPHLQSRDPGREVSIRPAPMCAAGCRSWNRCPTAGCISPGTPRRKSVRRAIRPRWWITPRPAHGLWRRWRR